MDHCYALENILEKKNFALSLYNTLVIGRVFNGKILWIIWNLVFSFLNVNERYG
jgi:hypothetical protein